MAENIGMNLSQVAEQRSHMRAHVAQLDFIATQVDASVASSYRQLAAAAPGALFPLPWGRLVATGMVVMSWGSAELAKSAAADIREATAAAEDLLGRLGVNISEQAEASSAEEGYLDGLMSRSRAEDLYRRALADPSVLADLSPLQIRAWWDRLSEQQQDTFVQDQHWIAGNTNGIPFDRRVEANELSVTELLQTSRDQFSDDHQEYLDEVAAGTRSLVSFDPAADRIIEMFGTITDETTNIVNYVPGTMASMDGFYDRHTQQFAQYVHDRAVPPGSTVAFVYKDSPFPTFDERGVYNSSWASSVGDPYHRFNTALDFENPGGIPVTSIEHSFGSSVGGYAETQGTTFDRRIVLAGIGMADGWERNPTTEYYSLTGSSDVIRAARERYSDDLNTGYPHPPTVSSGFIELDPGLGFEPGPLSLLGPVPSLVDFGLGSVDQHTTIAGVADNAQTLAHVIGLINS